jgi:hypothetical protein
MVKLSSLKLLTSLTTILQSHKRLLQVSFLILIWLIAVSSRIFLNGNLYGLDFSVFQPDGVLYALRTYMFLQRDQLISAGIIENWYFVHGASGLRFNPSSILPEVTPAWGLVEPRILYPLLSAPFLAIFGMYGMLVIPCLSLLVLVLSIFTIGNSQKQSNFSLVLCFILLTSPTVLRWMIANITDSLFVALFALTCVVLEQKKTVRRTYFYLGGLIILTNLTRFATPIWLALAVSDFVSGKKKRAVFISLTSLIATIPTFLTQPSNSVLPREGELTIIEKIFALPWSFVKILLVEVAQLTVLDRQLLIILTLALILSILNLKDTLHQRFILVLLAAWSIGALNGSIGVNFRYQLPVIPFACLVLLSSWGTLRNWFFGRIKYIEREEAQK